MIYVGMSSHWRITVPLPETSELTVCWRWQAANRSWAQNWGSADRAHSLRARMALLSIVPYQKLHDTCGIFGGMARFADTDGRSTTIPLVPLRRLLSDAKAAQLNSGMPRGSTERCAVWN